MTLSLTENALLEFVGDVITNECARPIPAVWRYHSHGLPDDCCTDDGVLSIYWERFNFSNRIPGTSAASIEPCAGVPYVALALRYVVCWPVPQVTGSGAVVPYAAADETAAMLADVAECVSLALVRVICDPIDHDELSAGVHARTMQDTVRFVESVPVSPSGGCAGVLWRLTLAPREAVTGS